MTLSHTKYRCNWLSKIGFLTLASMSLVDDAHYGACDTEALELAYSEYNYSRDVSSQISHVIIMHCLLGNRNTWDQVASDLAHKTGHIVYTLDLRNHGSSPASHNCKIQDYLADLELFLKSKDISRAHFIGHSLGAKIQLQLAFKKPQMIKSFIVVDYLPIEAPASFEVYMRHTGRVLGEIEEQLNESGGSNLKEAKRYCQQELQLNKIGPKSFLEALLSSLRMNRGSFEWAFKLKILQTNSEEFAAADTEDKCYPGPVLIISATHSTFVTPEEIEKISGILPNIRHEVIDNVSHNLHMDDPKTFVKKCVQYWAKPQTNR